MKTLLYHYYFFEDVLYKLMRKSFRQIIFQVDKRTRFFSAGGFALNY